MRINKIANRSQSHRKANKKQNKSPNNITYKEGNKSNKKKGARDTTNIWFDVNG